VGRVDDIDDQIVLLTKSLLVIVPGIMLGHLGQKEYSINLVTAFFKKNSEAARNVARKLKNDDMKEIREYSILTAKKYLIDNPEFKGTRNALMINIKPDIDKFAKKVGRQTASETTITSYLKKSKLP
jgi:hypothetical protein